MLLEYLKADERFREVAAKLRRGQSVYAPTSFAPYLAAGLLSEIEAPGWLVVAPDSEAAVRLSAELGVYLGREPATLPARGVLYGADVAPAAHIVGERQRALLALEQGDVVVADAVALLERFVPFALQPAPLRLAGRRGHSLRRRPRRARRPGLRA